MDGCFVEYSNYLRCAFCHDGLTGFFSFHGQEMRAAILSRVAPIFSTRAALYHRDVGNPKSPFHARILF